MMDALPFTKFLAGWLPALAVSATVDPAPRLADALLVRFGGVDIPVLTCALGLLGVLLARPLARRRETGTAAGWPTFLLVSLIMLIVVQLWIVESRPGTLFAFVVAIGLGFSGYSLIELIGEQVSAFVKRVVAVPTGKLGSEPAAPTSEETP